MYKWGDKLNYKEYKCIFIKHINGNQSAYVLLEGDLNATRVFIGDLF